MANSISKNPIVADTPGTSLSGSEKRINAIVFRGGTSAGASCELRDGTGGDVLFSASVGTAKETVTLSLPEPLRCSGLWLETLDANGVLLIFTSPSDRPYYP